MQDNIKFDTIKVPDQENIFIIFIYKSGVAILPGLAIGKKVLLPHFC